MGWKWPGACARSRWPGPTEVLVGRFAADAVLMGEDDFRNAVFSTMHELRCPFGGQGLLSSLVGSALLRQGDSLALPFPDQRTLKLGEGTHN